MLEKILKVEYAQNEKEYKIKKETINYLGDFVREHYSELVNAFTPNAVTSDFKFNDELLYYQTKEMLDELEKDATRLIGVAIYYGFNKQNSPDIKFGLTKYEKFSPDAEAYGKQLTEKGRQILNNYRKIKGLPSIEEANAKNSELLNRFLFTGK